MGKHEMVALRAGSLIQRRHRVVGAGRAEQGMQLIATTVALLLSHVRAAPVVVKRESELSFNGDALLPLDGTGEILTRDAILTYCSLSSPSVTVLVAVAGALCVCIYSLFSLRRFFSARLMVATVAPPYGSELAQLHSALTTSFDPDHDRTHEMMLRALWAALAGGAAFERMSSRWKEMGFQGLDPVTDVRGGGLLAMACIAHFAATHTQALDEMLDAVRTGSAEDHERFYPVLAVGVVICTRLCDALGLSHGMLGPISRAELNKLRRPQPKHTFPSALAKLLHDPKSPDGESCAPVLRRTLSDAGDKVLSYLSGRPRIPANFFNLFALALIDFHMRFTRGRKTYMQSKQLVDDAIDQLMLRANDSTNFGILRAAYFSDPLIACALKQMQS